MLMKGVVLKGKGKGKKLGFPTANLELKKRMESGVYAGTVKVDNKKYKAGVFVSRDERRLEAHLLNFSGNLVGREIRIKIGDKIREVSDFNNDEELKEQISKDIEIIRTYLVT
jgi:riboflavin kinase/FMN adenylyltransferase